MSNYVYSLSIEQSLDIIDEPLSNALLLQGFPGLFVPNGWSGISDVDRFCLWCATKLC